ncbi:MAG TPA: pinensin family lanthipeptide [Thermoanaerobaculia bacterium]|nr:pinensin family lanthipeptide [Thermoanaerobaculia bacterium]
MKKLTLNLDDLKVESFETASNDQGTVFGYDPVSCPTCDQETCSTCPEQHTCQFRCTFPLAECLGSSGGYICV